MLISLCEAVPEPDWVNICLCVMFLDNAEAVAAILRKLMGSGKVCRISPKGGLFTIRRLAA